MSELLRVTTIQTSLHWENIPANLDMFSTKLEGLAGQTDLVILPEMFTTGFSMDAAKLAEGMDGQTIRWLQKQSAALDAVVAGSFIARENGQFFNRFVWMQPDGNFQAYDKRHLFTLAGEHKIFSAGREKIVAQWKGWKACPLICYDLRFPVWSRNVEDYDLMIYVANWPTARSHHWRGLLLARAIENQAYVAGVNRIGTDGAGLQYSGDTSLIDFSGAILHQVSGVEDISTKTISKSSLQDYRKKLHFLSDMDKFKVFN
jgi:predicted amidohydrolase